MARRRWSSPWHRVGAALVVAATSALAALPSAATAQDVPGANTGPQFGDWAPGRGAPGAAPLVAPPAGGPTAAAPAPGAPPGAPAPAAPAPGVPSPSWGGCNHNLGGSWASSGQENTPQFFAYDGTVSVQQYGRWLQATESQGWAQTQYYGQCQGDSVRFDVYSNGQFIGYQYGTVHGGGRWGWPRISFDWATWAPNYAAGTEHWRRAFQ